MRKRVMFLMALAFVCLVTFSNATYAWFSKQYNPQVDNLSFNVSTQENMMISKTGVAGTFKDNIDFSELISDNEITLKPMNAKVTENSINMYDGNVLANNSSKFIKFSLYFSGSNNMDVYLAGSTSGNVINSIRIENSAFTADQIAKMVDSIRIGFLAYSTRETPTSSGTAITYDPLFTNIYSVNEKNDASYSGGLKPYETFNNIGHTEGILDDVVLLNVHANKISKMDVYIWLEDSDVSCDESIFTYNDSIKVNLRFLAVKNEGDVSSE